MMKNNAGDDLVALICSLDRSEKRYFKMLASQRQQKEEKVYLLLYAYLEQTQAWNESAIRIHFKGRSFLKQLSVARTELQHLILDALRSYHQGKTAQLDFSRRLGEVEILYHHKLHRASLRAVQSARKKAAQLELPAQEIECLQWQMRILRQSGAPGTYEKLLKIHARMRLLQQQLQDEAELLLVLDTISHFTTHAVSDRDQIVVEQAMKSPVLDRHLHKLSFDGRILYHYIHATLGFRQQLLPQFFEHHLAIIAIWDEVPDRIRLDQERYFKLLTGYAESCCQNQKYQEVERILARLNRLLDRSSWIRPSEGARLLSIELHYYMAIDDWTHAFGMLAPISRTLESWGVQIPATLRVQLLANSMITAFFCERWLEALQWGDRLATEPSTAPHSQWFKASRIVRWIAWYQTLDHDRLESELKPILASPADNLIWQVATCLKRMLGSSDASEERAVVQSILDHIDAYQDITPVHINLLQIWSRSQLIDQPMQVIAGA